MVIANLNKHIAPYWGEGSSLVSGLNQLGIRNVSEELFTVLLPGLNNVSLRIRYYSFYCWIIKKFYEGKQTVIDKDFNIFIRKAELLVALINATLEDRSGIPGINFAIKKVDSDDETFSLDEGAAIKGDDVYWKNPGGVLRQYYVASLEEMGLIGQNEKYPSIYNITKNEGYVNGLMLADEFEESIAYSGNSFLKIIERGSVSRSELREMNVAFGMKYLHAGNRERVLLQQMLLQKDNPLREEVSTHRRMTVKYILEYISKSQGQLKASDFSRYMYDNYFNTDDLTAWGWYAYYLDNNWQYQMTRIFHEILAMLKSVDNQWIAVEDISGEIADKTLADFQSAPDKTLNEFIGKIDARERHYACAESLRNLLAFHRDNKTGLRESKSRYQELGIKSENFCDFMKSVNSSSESESRQYVIKLVEDIIYRHYRVSFRKMLQTQKATQKFAFENGCLRFIDDWDATNTSPRIDTMRNFLIDLNIIEPKDGRDALTELGAKLFKELRDENRTA